MPKSEMSKKEKSKLMTTFRFLVQLFVATIVTFLVASTLHTQSVLSNLISLGVEIPLSLKIKTVFEDFIGLLPSYGLIILIGMLIAMLVAGLISKTLLSKTMDDSAGRSHTQESQLWLYSLAGAVAIFTILAAMYPIMNITIIAGARGLSGMLMQSVAGAIGGLTFAIVKVSFDKRTKSTE
jgi:uncharacterized membrane protein YiaA